MCSKNISLVPKIWSELILFNILYSYDTTKSVLFYFTLFCVAWCTKCHKNCWNKINTLIFVSYVHSILINSSRCLFHLCLKQHLMFSCFCFCSKVIKYDESDIVTCIINWIWLLFGCVGYFYDVQIVYDLFGRCLVFFYCVYVCYCWNDFFLLSGAQDNKSKLIW